ncbi:MAG: hypothetical protein C4337_05490 [Armatimonadota bacterium]
MEPPEGDSLHEKHQLLERRCRMARFRLLKGVLFACALCWMSAPAQMWTFHDMLSGSQEVPPNDSPASGMAMGTYNQSTRTLQIMVSASGFQGNLTAGHIHRGATGTNGPVVFFLTNTTQIRACGCQTIPSR